MTATLLLQRNQSSLPEGLPPVVVPLRLVSTGSPAAEMRPTLSLAQVHPACTQHAHACISSIRQIRKHNCVGQRVASEACAEYVHEFLADLDVHQSQELGSLHCVCETSSTSQRAAADLQHSSCEKVSSHAGGESDEEEARPGSRKSRAKAAKVLTIP